MTAAFAVPSAILGEATLSFLGVGIIPPTPSWGQMINEGFPLFSSNPWAVLLPGDLHFRRDARVHVRGGRAARRTRPTDEDLR